MNIYVFNVGSRYGIAEKGPRKKKPKIKVPQIKKSSEKNLNINMNKY